MLTASPFQVVRPFLWLAAIGFTLGFLGFLLIGGAAQALDANDLTPITDPLVLTQDLPRAA